MFSKRLRELIKEKGVTLNILGKKLEISTDLLSKYENNIISPKSDDIIKLAHYFDVTTDYLLGTTLVRNHIDTVAAHKANPHEDLPEEAQEQLNDYIEFLMNKYKNKLKVGDKLYEIYNIRCHKPI
ncbi:helix-turn-helix domain-containing protein [Clostridioides difficile]|nr:helix-turn-helix domain-containing protein [Clostridioides difficile]